MDIAAVVLLVSGLVFFTGGGIGIVRLPDFYTRLHPAGKLDTLGSLLMMAGLALYNVQDFSWEAFLTSAKMILIVAFIFVSSPTATHSIVDAGVRAGLEPWIKSEERD
jgi:multicomponent Na+:H+ antiporter subunit G